MRKPQKPIRLYVLTIFVVLVYGALPLVSTLPFGRGLWLLGIPFLPLNGSIWTMFSSGSDPPFVFVFISLFLSVFAAASAIWAFVGYKEGKYSTLIFVTLDLLWWSVLVIFVIMGSDNPGSTVISLALELIVPPFWLGMIWWNFLRPDVVDYYQQQEAFRG